MKSFALDWLLPVLDVCRQTIEQYCSTHTEVTILGGVGSHVVTDLDFAVEELLIDSVRSVHPKASILSEETYRNPTALDDDICFVIDPIDGTKEFVAGSPNFSISVGAFHQARPIAGILDFPRLNLRFTCQTDKGVALNGIQLERLPDCDVVDASIAASSKQLTQATFERFWSRFSTAQRVPVGALTPKVASIATGRCNAAVDLPSSDRCAFIWDYAAAAMVLRELGGTLMSFSGLELLDELPFSHRGGWTAGPRDLCQQISNVWDNTPA